MGRKSLKLAFITKEAPRKARYNQRLNGLKKQMSELMVLCDVVACIIVCNPFNFEPEVWPNVPRVQQVLDRFQSLTVKDQRKKMLNQETLVKKRTVKLRRQLDNIRKDNRQKEMIELMNQCLADMSLLQNLMPQDMKDLMEIVDQRLIEVNSRIEAFKKGSSDQGQVTPTLAPTPEQTSSSSNCSI